MKKGILAGLLCVVFASQAFAAITLPTELSLTPFETVASLVAIGLASIWGFRKVIKLMNRS